jgi:hypothetical protein
MDRFASLLLGLPYGVNDAHFPHLVVSNTGDADFVPHLFTHKCAFIAGKILDRNLTGNTSSYAATIDLDDELSTIASAMPPEWWDVPSILCGDEAEIDHLRTRLQQHVYFFQLRTYLHLPFLINASKSDPYHHSKLACVEGARQMLRRFVVYHAMVNGEKLFECKTADFVGFMAAAILLIGLSKLDSGPRLELSQEDSKTISSTKAVFCESEKKGCRIAAQCQKALMLLSSTDSYSIDDGAEPIKIPIPYFGVLVRRRMKDTSSSSILGQCQSAALSTQAKSTTSEDLETNALTAAQVFLDPLNSTYSMLDDMSWEVDEFGNLPILDTTQWFNTETMEIDQDWTMFLNNNIS